MNHEERVQAHAERVAREEADYRASLKAAVRSVPPPARVQRRGAYRGVNWDPNRRRWAARVCIRRERLSLGLFRSEEEAARAYDEAQRRYGGPGARLNFPAAIS